MAGIPPDENDSQNISQENQAERRVYFRLKDTITLEYELLGNVCLETDPYSSELSVPPHLKLVSELQKLEKDSNALLQPIMEHNRHVGNYLRVLNRRIDCLSRFIATDRFSKSPHPTHEVNLSEGGVAFEADEELTLNSFLHVKIVLFPSLTNLAAIGKVTYCEQHGSTAGTAVFRVGMEFEHITDPDRQQLAKHIIQEQLRLRREQQYLSPK